MNTPLKTTGKPVSNSDSLFGMALAGAFLGVAFGPAAEQIWDAGEACSAVYEDRVGQKRTNGRDEYELGVKNSLGDTFARMSRDLPKTAEAAFFRPAPRALSFAL